MTVVLVGTDLARRINEVYLDSAVDSNSTDVWIDSSRLLVLATWLKDTPELEFESLTSISAVDYIEYFEIVYHLLSMKRNQSLVLKTRVYDRNEPTLASVIGVWRGAELQEREIWDLMGIRFEGHPNMKRILLWEDFPGHPLRKDFVR